MQRYRNTLESYSSQTQTENLQKDAFCQTLSEATEKALLLDVAVQTLESHLEQSEPFPPNEGRLEQVKREEESDSPKNIRELLEAAMMNRVDNEYPCNICQKKFSSLYDVKVHLIAHDQNNDNFKKESNLPSTANIPKNRKSKKTKRTKLTSKKKPWCNYCWIKFKNMKQYTLHKKALHPNLPARNLIYDKNHVASTVSESKTVNLHDKDDEGDEIVDRPMNIVEAAYTKSPLIKYQRVESNDKSRKRKMISLLSEADLSHSPVKSIKLIKSSEGYATISEHNKVNIEQLSKSTPSQGLKRVPEQINKDPEVHFPFKANPSVDNLTISRNRAIRQRNGWDSKKKELLALSPLPIKDLRVILNERVEKEKHIDPTGVYICTELDKLGVTIEEFHDEMDKLPVEEDLSLKKEKLPWYEVKTHQCLLCSSIFSIGNFSYHLHDVHTTTLQTYKTKFPAANLKVPTWTCKVCLTDLRWTGPSIRTHLTTEHQLNLETYVELINSRNTDGKKDFSLPWFEFSVIKCNICDNMMSSSNISDHLAVRHSCSLEDYKKIFSDDVDFTAPLFECEVCREKVSWNRRSIQQHLTAHHMTLQAYDDTFVSRKTEQKVPVCSLCNEEVPDLDRHITGQHNLNKAEYLNIFPAEGEKFSKTKEESAVVIKIKQEKGIIKAGTGEKETSPNVERQMPWYESRLTSCLHCSKQLWHGKFLKHLHKVHNQSVKEYKATFPSACLEVGQYQCLICGASLAHYSSPISGHLTSRHGITVTEYFLQYQQQHQQPSLSTPSKVNKFQCKVCGTETDCAYESIRKHLLQHGLSWSQYQTFPHTSSEDKLQPPATTISKQEEPDAGSSSNSSQATAVPLPPPVSSPSQAASKLEKHIQMDPYYNKCKWSCFVCYKVFSSGFWRHVNETHFMKKDEYLEDYGREGIMIVNYSCLLCNKKIPWTGVNISNHLRSQHNISLLDYENNYRKKVTASRVLKQPSSNSNKSEKWFNGSEYHCQLCSRTMFSMAGLTSHLKEAHNRDKSSYLEEFGSKGIIAKHYQCKICGSYFPWTGVSISKHLRLAHSLSLSEYSLNHLNNKLDCKKVNNVSVSVISPKVNHVTKDLRKKTESVEISSTKWYNKCSWTCQICGRVERTNSSVFFKHVAQEHNRSVEEYKEEFGSKGVLYSDHKCKICARNVPQNGLSLCKHLKHSHQLSLREYESQYLISPNDSQSSKPYSPSEDSWYNKTSWTCNICGNKNKSLGSSKKHIQQTHSITYDEYFSVYGNQGIHEVEFTCVLCNAVMSCNGVTIANHLINSHRMTIGEYESKHLKKEDLEEETPDIPEKSTPSTTESGTGEENSEVIIKKEIEEESPETSVNTPESYSYVSKEDRPWYQQCLYVCQLCGASYFSTSALNNHCKRNHNMDRNQYIAKFGDTGKFIEYYTCKICNKVFKCEGKALGAHISSVHKMSLESYSALYEPDRNSELNPTLDNEYYQIELNVDKEDEEMEVDPLAANEEHFKIVSVASLTSEADEVEKIYEDSLDDQTIMDDPDVEIDEEFPELFPSFDSTEALESCHTESEEKTDGAQTIAVGVECLVEDMSEQNEERRIAEENKPLETESVQENVNVIKKICNIRDIFDSDSE